MTMKLTTALLLSVVCLSLQAMVPTKKAIAAKRALMTELQTKIEKARTQLKPLEARFKEGIAGIEAKQESIAELQKNIEEVKTRLEPLEAQFKEEMGAPLPEKRIMLDTIVKLRTIRNLQEEQIARHNEIMSLLIARLNEIANLLEI